MSPKTLDRLEATATLVAFLIIGFIIGAAL